MYDIDLYTYKEKPYMTCGKYVCSPLDEPGNNKYLFEKESHVYTYLDNKNPIIFRNFVGEDYDIINHKFFKLNRPGPKAEETKEKENQENKNLPKKAQEPPKKIKPKSLKKMKRSASTSNIPEVSYLNATNVGMSDMFFKRLTRKRNLSNHQMKEKNYSTGIFKPNKYFQSFHRKMSFQDVFGYPQPLKGSTREEECNYRINKLKDNVNISLRKQRSNSCVNINNHSLNEFTMKNLPRTDFSSINKKKRSDYFKFYTKVMNQSLNIPHDDLIKEEENKVLINKNNELKNKIEEQTNDAFLSKTKLPDIRKMPKTNQVSRTIKMGITKEMGEKYNPFSFVLKTNQIKGRNYTGGIFQY